MKQVGEEVLYRVAEGVCTLLEAGPRALGLWLGRLAPLPDLFAGGPCALRHRVANTLARLFDSSTDLTIADLLGAGLHLLGRGLDLGVVGRRGDAGGSK